MPDFLFYDFFILSLISDPVVIESILAAPDEFVDFSEVLENKKINEKLLEMDRIFIIGKSSVFM